MDGRPQGWNLDSEAAKKGGRGSLLERAAVQCIRKRGEIMGKRRFREETDCWPAQHRVR